MAQRCQIIPMPVSPIERLASHFRNVLHLPDPGPLYVLMSAVAANMVEGPPIWLMLVGAPSCGKCELLNSLLAVPHMVEAADLASEAAFLSGSAAKDCARDATGGLLRQTGTHGGLILNDFTSVLSKPSEKVSMIMAVLRECYGGRWTRHIGGEGGRAIQWTGKLALLAGCTGRIDQHHQISAELGERWIYYRFEERADEAFAEVMMALSKSRAEGWRETLAEHVRDFFDDLELHFREPVPRRLFTDSERIRIHELATMAVRCRSGVTRDNYSKEIIGARESELAVRLATVLAQLLVGMGIVGVPAKTQWKLLAKVAMDSMPRLRKMVIQAIAQKPRTSEELKAILGCSLSVVKRVVEDLAVHDICQREDNMVVLSDWMAHHYPRLI